MTKRSSIPDSWRTSKTASDRNEMLAGGTIGAGVGFGVGTLASYIPGVTRDKAQTLGTALGTVAGVGFGANGGFAKLKVKKDEAYAKEMHSLYTDLDTHYPGLESLPPTPSNKDLLEVRNFAKAEHERLQPKLAGFRKESGLTSMALRHGSRLAGAGVGAAAGAMSSSNPDESQQNMFIGALAGAGLGGMKQMRSAFNNNALKPAIRGANGAMQGIAKDIPRPQVPNAKPAMQSVSNPVKNMRSASTSNFKPTAQGASMPNTAPSQVRGQQSQPGMMSRLKNSVSSLFSNGNGQSQNPSVIRSIPLKPSNNLARPNVPATTQKLNTAQSSASGGNPASQFRSQPGQVQQPQSQQHMVKNVPQQIQHNKNFAVAGV